MKNVLLTITLILPLVTSVFSSSPDDSVKAGKVHRLSGFIELQSLIGIGKVKSHQKIEDPLFPVDTVYKPLNSNYFGLLKGSLGYQYKNMVYVGMGSGIQFGRNINGGTKKIDQIMVPLFLETRITFTQSKVQPYFNQAIGYSFYFDQYFSRKDTLYQTFAIANDVKVYQDKKNTGGLFFESAIGAKVNFSKVALNFGCGYSLLYLPLTYYYSYKLNLGYQAAGPSIDWALSEKRLAHYMVLTAGVSF